MTRLAQSLAIRDVLLDRQRGRQRFAGPYSPAGRVTVFLPGFECMLSYDPHQPDRLPYSLQIWPVSNEPHPIRPNRKMLQNKVLHLAWSNQGPAHLISLRKPREWADTLLGRLRDNTTVHYLNESKKQP